MTSLSNSYTICERLAQREAGNFYLGFRVLPRPQRLSMCALYAFMRIADDLSDEEGSVEIKRRNLKDWRRSLHRALVGQYDHATLPALAHTIQTYNIPTRYLEDVIDGVEMDLSPVSFTTFDDLRVYCYRVASAVGLACIHIWGFSHDRAKQLAEDAGYAFQLTNILRDLKEDADRGRIYLPTDDLARFDYTPDELRRGERNAQFEAMMQFQVQRARSLYDSSWALTSLLSPAGRAVFLTMARTYRGLLNAIEDNRYDVFSGRISLSKWRKVMFALGSLPARWGW